MDFWAAAAAKVGLPYAGEITTEREAAEEHIAERECTRESMSLKKLTKELEVDNDGNVEIYLRLLGDLGLDDTVLISNNHT